MSGDGQIVPLPAPPTATAPTAPGNPGIDGTGTIPGGTGNSPFVINITYGASVARAPAGFVAGVEAAVRYLESQ